MKKPMATASLAGIGVQWLDDDSAREIIEKLRWPNGLRCVKCGSADGVYRVTSAIGSKTRKGLLACRDCRGQFTVTVGTIFEDSHIPLGKWLAAIHLMAASKKGISAHQLHRMLGLTYKSAWFMAHRIREAMKQEPLAGMLKLTGIVESDETWIGGKPKNMHKGRRAKALDKVPVLSLVQRGGEVRSFRIPNVTGNTLKAALREQVDCSAKVMTDGGTGYKGIRREFKGHGVVNHDDGEYVRGAAHVNTAEAYFSILKRGVNGTFHHISAWHLPRYLAEFDRRWNTRHIEDADRTAVIVKAAEGRRLTYKPLVNRNRNAV